MGKELIRCGDAKCNYVVAQMEVVNTLFSEFLFFFSDVVVDFLLVG